MSLDPIEFLVPDLAYNGRARQVSLLAPAIQALARPVAVRAVRENGPLQTTIRSSGVDCESVEPKQNWQRFAPVTGEGVVIAVGMSAVRKLIYAYALGKSLRFVAMVSSHDRPNWIERRFLRRAECVIVPNDAMRARVVNEWGVPSGRVRIVPIVVGPATAPRDRASLLAELRLRPEHQLAVTIASYDHFPRLSDMIWSFEFLRYGDPQFRLLVIGDGPVRDRLEAFAVRLAPEGTNALFLGQRADASSILAAADVAFVPHRWGGTSFALEALAAGKPTVMANTPDLAPLAGNGMAALMAPTANPPVAAAALRRFLYDLDLRAEYAEKARIASTAHQVDRVAKSLLDAIR